MSKLKPTVLALGGVLGMSAVASSAHAEDAISYCRDYARAAIQQAHAARDIGRCHHFIRETPARWSLNYSDHFNWCKSVYGSGENAAERHAREQALNDCSRG
jgi:hypothetical protein